MTAYIANHQKKKRIFEKRENELRHDIRNKLAYDKIAKAAEKLRMAKLGIFKSEYSRLAVLPAHTYEPSAEAKEWQLMPVDEIIAMWQPNHGINTEAKQLVSLKVFGVFIFSAFLKGSGTFGPGYAKRYALGIF